MITSTTPYKLAEIIRDTWPQLYTKQIKNNDKTFQSDIKSIIRKTQI